MSFFERSSGFQLNGGNFYNVAGDMNIERPVEDSCTRSSDVRVSGIQRSNTGSVRYTPYSNSTRPWGQSSAHACSRREEHAEASSTSEHIPESQLPETTVSLYPDSEQFFSLTSPPIPINPNFYTLDRAISYPPTDIGLQINGFPSRHTDLYTERLGIYLPHEYVQPTKYIQPTTTINGGIFVGHTRSGEKGIDKLHSAAALEALHDSADSFPQPRCHPETRTKMLEDLQEWSQETDPTSSILWLFGPAGAGKSAIMQTLSRQLQSTGRLGGCFFFKRAHPTRGNAKALFVTVAYQLALDVPKLKGLISQVVERNPSVLARSIEIQLQKLISEPSRMHPDSSNSSNDTHRWSG